MKSLIIRIVLPVLLLASGGYCLTQAMAAAPAAKAAWDVRCDTPKDKKTPKTCEAYQQLSIQQKGQKTVSRLAEMAIGYPAEKKGKPRGVLILPLGIALDSPMTLAIGEQKPLTFRVRYCERQGCFAYLNFEQAQIDLMKKADKLKVTVSAMTGKNISIIMSLKGFGSAIDKAKG